MLVTLIVMDGWGLNARDDHNAVAQANTPFFDYIWNNWPSAALEASGPAVGLPVGQMGNSEVGHMNLGAGRIVPQDLTYINGLIESGEFFETPALNEAVQHALDNNSALHLMGLLSDGGVHSHQKHLYAILQLAKQKGLSKVFIHAMMDGRDTPPRGGGEYLKQLESQIEQIGCGQIATVTGRYYSMDRDKRWERTKLAYDAIVDGVADKTAGSSAEAISASYNDDVGDEFVLPVVLTDESGVPIGKLQDNDAIIFFNFRADRARQMSHALIEPSFDGFEVTPRKSIKMITFMHYYDNQQPASAFAVPELVNGLSETVSKAGLKQFHSAETEKYPHVTYFFNGGQEVPFEGEQRTVVPSPKVPTYDLQPEMSAQGVKDAVVEAIKSGENGFVLVNFANPDMVGHTGFLDKAIIACETVDDCVRQVVEATVEMGGVALVTADHGNSDQMLDYDTGKPHTAHTTNLVPFVYVGKEKPSWRFANGQLGNVAPTVLALMGVEQPADMTCESLIREQ
ncbi:2,3-bisphosphoglycerate-independent phosphoglycerate mutase [Anaerolineales bacterium HSG25]|nr:2,3-bisphosphoglycerate-independent phosphoglycerate mutase [Anaerolineales bacterium HSG25]